MDGHVSTEIFGVFTEGLLSFFSPCVLPLVPLYLSYLSAGREGEETSQGKVFLRTLCFVLGISSVFALLTFSASLIGSFLQEYREVIGILGGALLIVFALNRFGILEIKALSKEYKLPADLSGKKMDYLQAFFFGFLFSFGWTPCIGPMLGNVLLLAASNAEKAWLYLLSYDLGFVLPFLVLGIFTQAGLSFLRKHRQILRYTGIAAAVVLLLFGGKMIYDNALNIAALKSTNTAAAESTHPYLDAELTDQNGNAVTLRQDQGKVVYLNFISTWCTYCKAELPVYQAFLKENGLTGYYLMSNTMNGEEEEAIYRFIEENDVEVPVLIDRSDQLFRYFGINAVPTIFVLNEEGEALGYISGALDEAGFASLQSQVEEMLKGE